MKKAKSSTCLTNLAVSIKKSIDNDCRPFTSTQRPTRQPKQQQTQSVSVLHQQIEQLQKQISSNQFSSKKMNTKHYDEQLKKYQNVSRDIENNEPIIQNQKDKVMNLTNTLCMIEEDHHSRQMNLQDELAEMEYHEEILEKYKYEFENQSQILLDLFDHLRQLDTCRGQIVRLQESIDVKEKQLILWRQQSGYDFSQKVNKQKISQLRIHLMKIQDQMNVYAESHSLLKLREILCVFLKQYASDNGIFLNQRQMTEGMEIYICKQELVEDYNQAVIAYKNKVKEKYSPTMIEDYFTYLRKIQSLLASPKYQQDHRINEEAKREIENMRKQLIAKEDKMCQQNKVVKELQKKLEEVFSNHSVVVIEHLRDSYGKYELHQIKVCLKNLKKQQKKRMSQIKFSYQRFKVLEGRVHSVDSVFYMNEYSEMKKKLQKQKKQLQILQKRQKERNDEKVKIEQQINLGISKWKQASDKKVQLRQLYRQLNIANRELRDSKLQMFREKSCKTTLKPSSSMATLRETIKTKMTRNNKQNQPRNTEERKKSIGSKFGSQQNFTITRKPSLVKTGRNTKTLSLRQTNRGSLASMVLTRLAK